MNWLTNYRANYRKYALRLVLLLLCVLILPAQAVFAQQAGEKKFLSAADPAIYYYGRTKPGDSVLWTWPGSGFRVAYNNSPHVSLKFFADNYWDESSKGMPRAFAYRIDRGNWQRVIVGAGTEDLFPLRVPGDSGTHVLEVVKTTEGQLTFRGILLESFGTLQATGSGRSGKIEFIGDSITAGFRIYGMGSFDIPENHDAKASYGWITGDRMSAEVRLIAITGRGLVHNFGMPAGSDTKPMPAYYPYMHRDYGDGNNWAAWQADTVVINLGTNDLTPPGDTPSGDFQNAYVALLTMVRQYNPGALIVALEPFGLKYGAQRVYPKEIAAAVTLRRSQGDERVTYISTAGWLGRSDFIDGVHLNARGHARAGSILAGRLRAFGNGPVPGPDTQKTGSANDSTTVTTNAVSNPTPVAATCTGAKETRLRVGGAARVIADGSGPSPLRNEPGGKIITNVPEGTLLKVFDGPRCFLRAWYWLVYLPDGRAGWISEADRLRYFIEPV